MAEPVARLVSVQPGGHRQTAYDKLAPRGGLVAEDCVSTVDTGGFVGGGGNSFYSASDGMAWDMLPTSRLSLPRSLLAMPTNTATDARKVLEGCSGCLASITRVGKDPIGHHDAKSVWFGRITVRKSRLAGIGQGIVEPKAKSC